MGSITGSLLTHPTGAAAPRLPPCPLGQRLRLMHKVRTLLAGSAAATQFTGVAAAVAMLPAGAVTVAAAMLPTGAAAAVAMLTAGAVTATLPTKPAAAAFMLPAEAATDAASTQSA